MPKIIQDFRKHNEADKKEYALVEAAELKLKKAQEEYAKARSKYDEIHNTDDIIETREIMRLIRRHDWLIEQINDREKVEALGIKRITPKLKGSSTKREIEEEIDSALLIIKDNDQLQAAWMRAEAHWPSDEIKYSHTDRSVTWKGITALLSPDQDKAFRMLFDAYNAGSPDVHNTAILDALSQPDKDQATGKTRRKESFRNRIQDIFKRCPLWKTLIVSSSKNGWWRLNPSAKAK